jgi:lipoprotein-releasing system permease protein
MHLEDASRMLGLDGRPQGLAVMLDQPMDVQRAEQALRAAAGPGFKWSNWASENASLFRAMKIEKIMMTLLLLIIVAVAAFNIVTSLTMVVNEKEKDIAILRTLGLEPGRVMRIFLVQGCLLGLAGTLGGVAVGLALATNLETILPWLERTFGFSIMPGDVFYVTEVPSLVEWPDLIAIAGFAFLIALAATIWPSRRAARVEPADVLRYE